MHSNWRRIAGLIVLLVFIIVPAVQAGTIKYSLHDLSNIMKNGEMRGWDNFADYNQVCVYCHTPHNSLEGEKLLWNREMPEGPYQLYGSESLISSPGAPGNRSLMCLSCHDGTISVDAVIRIPISATTGERPATWSNPAYPGYEPMHGKMANESQSTGGWMDAFVNCGVACHSADPIGAQDYSGTYMTQDMSDDHPVTIDYPDPLTYGNRFKPIPAGGRWPNGIQLYDNKVECESCHDVHNPDYKPFLRCSNDQSAICFTCHNK